MELYIHIPFCIQKCKYCDFLSFPSDEDTRERYTSALCNEIEYCGSNLRQEILEKRKYNQKHKLAKKDKIANKLAKTKITDGIEIETIYIGGGTPSVLGSEKLVQILQKIKSEFVVNDDAEITIEINPATIDKNGLEKLQKIGVNRLSIGLQSTFDDELELLGRIHNFSDFLKIFEDAREIGFKNLNVDLISALPGQTLEKYKTSIKKLIELNPEHISSYSLILEEGTPFYELYNKCPEKLPDEITDREMYRITNALLREAGYKRYEISNYAKPGFESKHNSGYWKRIPYLGLGLGASSLINNVRYRKNENLADYLQFWSCKKNDEFCKFGLSALMTEVEPLSIEDAMAEYMFLGLRMSEGVSIQKFEENFGKTIWEVYKSALQKLEKEQLLVIDEQKDRIYLTEFGMDVSNYVFEKFV